MTLLLEKLNETILCESLPSSSVDREAGIIRGVKIISTESKNGYSYTIEALREAVSLYTNKDINVDHVRDPQKHVERSIHDNWGTLKNIRFESDCLKGDIHYFKTHPSTEFILERAEKFPESFGLSHFAEGAKEVRNGKAFITKIERVHSVDLVNKPATTQSLFESENRNPEMKTKTIKQLLAESTLGNPHRKILLEMEDAGELTPEMGEVAVEIPAESSPEEQIKAGLMAAIQSKLEGADSGTLKKVMKALGIGDSVTGAMGGDAPSEGSSSEPEPTKTEESEKLTAKANLLEAENMLLKAGREATSARVNAVASVPVPERQALVESWSEAKPATGHEQTPFNTRFTSPPKHKSTDPANGGYDELKESLGNYRGLASKN